MIKSLNIITKRHFKMPQCILDNTVNLYDYDDHEPVYDYTYTYTYTYNNKNLF
jgi:hypothetical protein